MTKWDSVHKFGTASMANKDVMMMQHNVHHEIKAWGCAHDREIDHESIFTLKGYPPKKGLSCATLAHAWRY